MIVFVHDELNSTVYIIISYHSTRNDEPCFILFARNEKYNANIILLHGRIGFKAKWERRKMSSTNFKLRLLKDIFLTYMFIYIEISILQVINFTSTHVFQLNYIVTVVYYNNNMIQCFFGMNPVNCPML